MASDRHEEYFPTNRVDNILNDGPQQHEHGYPANEIEEPEDSAATLAQTNSSTDNDPTTPVLTRSGTTRSERLSRRNTFEELHSGDRAALQRLASQFGGTDGGLSRVGTRASAGLERQDTLAGIQMGDAVLDPNSPQFDVYKWVRMVRLLKVSILVKTDNLFIAHSCERSEKCSSTPSWCCLEEPQGLRFRLRNQHSKGCGITSHGTA